MQNGRMLLAATTLFFRAHTRVLTTLTVALAITCLCLASSARPPAPSLTGSNEKCVAKSALPVEAAPTELPRIVIRLFLLLPHLLPHDN